MLFRYLPRGACMRFPSRKGGVQGVSKVGEPNQAFAPLLLTGFQPPWTTPGLEGGNSSDSLPQKSILTGFYKFYQ